MPRQFEKSDTTGGPFRLGEWLIEPSLNRLSKGDTTIQLELKVMDVLVCLAERAGDVLTRQEIVDRVWATEFISDNTLTHAITELRSALGDDARNPSFIETIHRRGYRLIASVEPSVSDEAGDSKVARFPVSERAARLAEERSPYPGLASFTEDDAEFFFGREAEVAQMWRKLTSRRLLAVIGPSGVGKSSFLQAGVIPAKPEGWGVLVCMPGDAPFAALARALVPEFEDDHDSISKLVHLKEPGEAVAMVSRWRKRHHQVLLVVDQFEELFTLNPHEIQVRFAKVLRRLVDESDVHVLLSMRDDFLFHCHGQPALTPILDDLTLLGAPSPGSLRRAMVEPAKRLGFSFEDDDLAGEMTAEVEGERAALPLLAFSVLRLWDTRDEEQRLLTRQAYSDIGGVGGALARHADATLKGIGDERLGIVREFFRNLVTSQGTRAVRSVDDLLSVIPEGRRKDADEVLSRLVDARLLTSFEEEGTEGTANQHRVEVAHESLLTSWPRLVGWQTQDADSARLRDELRQAAKAWTEHERPVDWLWAGSQYREFASWRERYPGGLTDLEQEFFHAMTAHAKRRKRRRGIAVAALIAVLLAGLAIVGSFWQRSVREARRAEAANLVSLGQMELETYPSASVAHAIASLELADSQAARRLALKALWKGPTAMIVSDEGSFGTGFSPDGRFLLNSIHGVSNHIQVISSDGSNTLLEKAHAGELVSILRIAETGHFITYDLQKRNIAVWSVDMKECLGQTGLTDAQEFLDLTVDIEDRRWVFLSREDERVSVDSLRFDGEIERLGTLDFDVKQNDSGFWNLRAFLDQGTGSRLGLFANNSIYVLDLHEHGFGDLQLLGPHDGWVTYGGFDPLGRFFGTADSDGVIRFWSLSGDLAPITFEGPQSVSSFRFSADGSRIEVFSAAAETLDSQIWTNLDSHPQLLRTIEYGPRRGYQSRDWNANGTMVARGGPDEAVRVWTVSAPPDAEPMTLHRGVVTYQRSMSFEPTNSSWLATADAAGLALWPLTKQFPFVIRRHEAAVSNVVFESRGRWLASGGESGEVRLWPLVGESPESGRVVFEGRSDVRGLAVSPEGNHLLVGSQSGAVVAPIDGSDPTVLQSFGVDGVGVTFSSDGRFAAGVGATGSSERLVVWDVETWEEVASLAPEETISFVNPYFMADGRIVWSGVLGLHLYDPATGENELLFEGMAGHFSVSADEKRIVVTKPDRYSFDSPERVFFLDLEKGTATPLGAHGDRVWDAKIDPSGTMVITGDKDGVIRVGPVTGEQPHLLLGHEGWIWSVDLDPLGRWIASGGEDGTVRLWPMPDLSKPPLHTLPREELIAKLKTLTNLRVVRDGNSATGWKLEVGPFPGWETVPSW